MGNSLNSSKFESFVGRSNVVLAAPEEDDDLDDPVERMLKKTGCLEKHYSVLECIAETKDWRQCQKQVQDFKECMEKHKNTGGTSVVTK